MFNIVKFEIKNNSGNRYKKSGFTVLTGNKVFEPIKGKLNFIPDKMPETVSIESGKKYTTKIVWVLPKRVPLKVLVFKSSFSQLEIKYNLVDID